MNFEGVLLLSLNLQNWRILKKIKCTEGKKIHGFGTLKLLKSFFFIMTLEYYYIFNWICIQTIWMKRIKCNVWNFLFSPVLKMVKAICWLSCQYINIYYKRAKKKLKLMFFWNYKAHLNIFSNSNTKKLD